LRKLFVTDPFNGNVVIAIDNLRGSPVEPVDNLPRCMEDAVFGAVEQSASDPAQSQGTAVKNAETIARTRF
jgi:hypothetical protein